MIQVFEFQFSAAHFYRNLEWSEEKNIQHFGLCYSKEGYGHGHDYRAQVSLELIENESEVHKKLQKIQERFDHKHLNYEVPELKELIPTTENIALVLQEKLQEAFPENYRKLRLFENSTIWTEVTP
jgi:6-pyruvoyltetrahydropterin/6-carboxytetrahydropterin synthase